MILLFTQSLGMPLYKGDSRGEEWVKRGEELQKLFTLRNAFI